MYTGAIARSNGILHNLFDYTPFGPFSQYCRQYLLTQSSANLVVSQCCPDSIAKPSLYGSLYKRTDHSLKCDRAKGTYNQ